MRKRSYRISWFSLLLCLLCAHAGFSVAAENSERRVLIIGIDGLRPDALQQAATPNMDGLIGAGVYADNTLILKEYRENNTVSGASWSSILTGVWANKHGVHDNSFQGKNYEAYPHFFERVKSARTEAQTISMVSWRPIDTHIVSAADIRHIEPLPAELLDFSVSADEIDIDTRDGEWHHLVGLRRNGVVSMFVDGRLLGSINDTAGDFDLSGDFYKLGHDGRIDTAVFSGEKDQVRIWNRALSPDEIRAIASSGPPNERGWRKIDGLDVRELVADFRGSIEGSRIPLSAEISGITRGDWCLETWIRTTDRGRNILIGNHASGRNSLNFELHSNNRLRIYMNPRLGRIDHEEIMDGNMAEAAAALLRDEDPTAMFVYFHQTDFVGHTLGFSPEVSHYMNAVENVDRHVGTVLDALRSRPTYGNEDWLVIVCTDHGGLGTRHGGGHDDPEILNVPLIVSGSAVRPGKIARQTYIVDIVPTVLAHLGIEIDPAWELDGEPVGLKPDASDAR